MNKERAVGLIMTYQGMGDHICYNGLVRSLLIQHQLDEIYVLCWISRWDAPGKVGYAQQIAYMYRDNPKIKVLGMHSGGESAALAVAVEKIAPTHLFSLAGTYPPNSQNLHAIQKILPNSCYWKFVEDESIFAQSPYMQLNFYKICDVPLNNRFTHTFFVRDLAEEQRVLDKLNPNHEEYIFVHDDSRRGFSINTNLLFELAGKSYKVIQNDLDEIVFHYPMLLQNAKQIHVMESAIRCMLETISVDGVELFLHQYVRKTPVLVENNVINKHETRKPWRVL